MMFHSILYESGPLPRDDAAMPACFRDLNLDQLVDAVLLGKAEYRLEPFFYSPLPSAEAVEYRHEVMKELERAEVGKALRAFADGMRGVRGCLEKNRKLHVAYQKEWWLLEGARRYCETVKALSQALQGLSLQARGMAAFRDFLAGYAASEGFGALCAEVRGLFEDLAAVQYCITIKNCTVEVRKYDGEADYSVEVLQTFEKFKQEDASSYLVKFRETGEMNHVEAGVLELVARLYPEVFGRLDAFCAHNASFADATVAAFDREVQFYVSWLEFVGLFRQKLPFCYPAVSAQEKAVYDLGGYDLAMAEKKLRCDHSVSSVVVNDFSLRGPERIIVVTGPNQGGKTTFARTFGQLHFLASLGLPVPGKEARLFLFDSLFTHFEREEDIARQSGQLQDDLLRIHGILTKATPRSIIIMNEIFSSTALQDAVFLGGKVMEEIVRLDALCVCVTFLDELASLGEKTVSMVSTVAPGHPERRTFKVVRKPADGLSYAKTVAEKYRLTYAEIKERIEG